MPLIEIKNRFDGEVIYSAEALSLRDCLELSVKDNVNLGGADLGGADLGGAYLGGANLGGAYLGGADLGGAYLGGAYLGGAYLGGAYLGGAYLGGAYLGGAKIKDDIEISLPLIGIYTPIYNVMIFDAHMQIGCKFFSLAEWWGFDNRTIAEMDGKQALTWWGLWKAPLQAICQAEGRA